MGEVQRKTFMTTVNGALVEVTLTGQSPTTDTRKETTKWVICQFWEIQIIA